MKKRLYHGSKKIIASPSFGAGNLRNDYGRGFYCTEHKELAKEWACAGNADGFCNCYELEMEGLSVFNFNTEPCHILNWLAVLTKNRTYWQNGSIAEAAKTYLWDHYLIDLSGYDVITGYRADDSYFSFAQDFVMGVISLEKLSQAMQLGNLGEQIVLKSKLAFERIHYVGNEEARAETYFIKKMARDQEARREYRAHKKRTANLEEAYIIDIMRKELTDDEIRIRSGISSACAESYGRHV